MYLSECQGGERWGRALGKFVLEGGMIAPGETIMREEVQQKKT